MNSNEQNGAHGVPAASANEDQEHEFPRPRPPLATDPDSVGAEPSTHAPSVGTRQTDVDKKPNLDKQKLIVLGASLLAAVLFFAFVSLFGRHAPARNVAKKQPAQQAQQKNSLQQGGSATPLMDVTPRNAAQDDSDLINPSDIQRMRTNSKQDSPAKPFAASTVKANALGAIPSFADTQQRWEDPLPYTAQGEPSGPQSRQAQNALKEPSLVFVRSVVAGQGASAGPVNSDPNVLQIEPGTRIEAKLETQISTAVSDPVIAVVEYTYAIGDHVVIPAGTRAIGQLRQADRFGNVDVKFNELDMSEDTKEAIDASGRALDMGPIKGTVTGKNTGKNFLVRAGSGLGSVAAMIVGNNTSSAFSEDDLLRERVAENIGEAGDSQVMSLNASSKIVVSVAANTKIYIVFSKAENHPQALHTVPANTQ
jgi:hypothetical protein